MSDGRQYGVVDVHQVLEWLSRGVVRTQRQAAEKLGVTEQAVSAALKRHREKEMVGVRGIEPWGRKLPWSVPRREQPGYVYHCLVLLLKDREGVELQPVQKGELRNFKEQFETPLDGAPLGLALYWTDEWGGRWMVRRRTKDDEDFIVPE